MKLYKYALICFVSTLIGNAQKDTLAVFKPLDNTTWVATAMWKNGGPFNQEISYELQLDNKVLVTETKSYYNSNNETKFQKISHGIKQYNKETKQIDFYEFSIRGNVTKGKLTLKDRNFYYTYKYGKEILTDAWEYKNDSVYDFTIGVYDDGKWKKTYLHTWFRKKQ